MSAMTSVDLNSPEVDTLVRVVEESTRASDKATSRFVEPARGTLDRAKSERHHLVFGRRGSGKSSLLKKAAAELSLIRKPVAFVDLETFKGHSYPDVLLSVLIASLQKFEEWLRSAGSHPASKTSFWQRLFGTRPKVPPLDKKKRELLMQEIASISSELEKLLYAQDGAKLETTNATKASSEKGDSFSLKAGYETVGADYSDNTSQSSDTLLRSK